MTRPEARVWFAQVPRPVLSGDLEQAPQSGRRARMVISVGLIVLGGACVAQTFLWLPPLPGTAEARASGMPPSSVWVGEYFQLGGLIVLSAGILVARSARRVPAARTGRTVE